MMTQNHSCSDKLIIERKHATRYGSVLANGTKSMKWYGSNEIFIFNKQAIMKWVQDLEQELPVRKRHTPVA